MDTSFTFIAVVVASFTPYANSYSSYNPFIHLTRYSLQVKGASGMHRFSSDFGIENRSPGTCPYFTMEIDAQRQQSKGGLKSLPRVFPAAELWARALKRSTYVKEDTSIQNARIRCRKLAAERLSVLSKELTKPLGSFLDGYGSVLSRLPPFEKVVVDLTVRHRYLF
jgi:hypothetical protein